MPNPLDWHQFLLPLQDFDTRAEIPHMTQMGGVRIHEPSPQHPYGPDQRDTLGSVWGSFLVREAQGGARSYVPLWFLGGAGYVQTEEAKPATPATTTAPGAGVTKPRGGQVGQSWQPELKEYEPDTRLEAADVKPPDWAKDQKFPAGYPAVVTQGTQEHEQNLHLHPAMWGLFAVNAGGDPQAGTLVYELDDKGKPELSQHLQSIFTVTDLGAGACDARGKVVGLTLAKSKQDGLSGHLPMVEWLGQPPGQIVRPGQPKQPAKITCIAAGRGGTPFKSGGLGDQHTIGVDADGDPIQPLHLSLDTIFKGLEGDCPLDFDPANYEENSNLPGAWQKVYLRHNFRASHPVDPASCVKGVGRWSWQVQTPLFEPKKKEGDPEPPRGDPPPPTPPEIGEPLPPRGPVTGGGTGVLPGTFFGAPITDVGFVRGLEVIEPIGGIGSEFDGGQPSGGRTRTGGGSKLVGEEDLSPSYAGIANCLVAYGGIAVASPSHVTGQDDYTGRKNLTAADLARISEAPLTGVIQGWAGDFVWGNEPTDDTVQNLSINLADTSLEPMLVVAPPGVSMQDVASGDTSRKASLCVPDSGKMVFGPPHTSGSLRNVIAIEPDGAGDADVVSYDGSGSTTNNGKLSSLGGGGGAVVSDATSGTTYYTPQSGTGGAIQLFEHEETVTGGTGAQDTTSFLQAGDVIKHVWTYVVTAPDGAGTGAGDTYSVGFAADTDRWGTSASINAGATTSAADYNIGTATPDARVTSTANTQYVRITPNGWSGWGAGEIRVTVLYERTAAQTA